MKQPILLGDNRRTELFPTDPLQRQVVGSFQPLLRSLISHFRSGSRNRNR